MAFNLDFSDFAMTEVPFELLGVRYVLREASSSAATKYNNERTNRVVYGADGKVSGVRDIADLGPLLVSLCCFEAESGKAVDVKTVLSWPQRVVSELFETAKTISYLQDEKPFAKELLEALDSPDSPVSRATFTAYIANNADGRFRELRRILETAPSAKES